MSSIQLSINLKDLFTEHESEDGYVEFGLADALKQSLVQEARNEIKKMVDGKVSELLNKTFVDRFDLIINAMADKAIEIFQETPEFKSRYGVTTMDDLIKSKLERIDYSGKCESMIKDLALKHTGEIKSTFDQRYASGVVEGLNKNGLLNNQAANLLIGKGD